MQTRSIHMDIWRDTQNITVHLSVSVTLHPAHSLIHLVSRYRNVAWSSTDIGNICHIVNISNECLHKFDVYTDSNIFPMSAFIAFFVIRRTKIDKKSISLSGTFAAESRSGRCLFRVTTELPWLFINTAMKFLWKSWTTSLLTRLVLYVAKSFEQEISVLGKFCCVVTYWVKISRASTMSHMWHVFIWQITLNLRSSSCGNIFSDCTCSVFH